LPLHDKIIMSAFKIYSALHLQGSALLRLPAKEHLAENAGAEERGQEP
jgi:hypothetical protein